MLQPFVLIVALCTLTPANAFWWPKTTTEAPATVLQQIPLTYFRTYTYQPLAGSPFSLPLFGFGAAQTPLLSSPRFDPYSVTSYASARRHEPGGKPGVTPPALGSSPSVSSTTTPATTTTTTTTTPSTTTSTTTSSTTTTSTTPAPSSHPDSSLRFGYQPDYQYPTYSRRLNNLYNARPQYPYPDYFNYQPQSSLTDKNGARIQFVPCMCPVSVSSGAHSAAGAAVSNSQQSLASMVSSSSSTSSGVTISSALDATPIENSVATLQARNMLDAAHEAEEDEFGAPGTTAKTSKLIIEAHETTTADESNSLN